MSKPSTDQYPEYFQTYVNKVAEDDLSIAFENQKTRLNNLLDSIPEAKRNFRYAPGKWTVQEVIQHCMDTERIFAYRALCIARNETASLPGFDENKYAAAANADKRNWDDVVEEINAVRQSTELLFHSFTAEQLRASGIANNKSFSVEAIGFIIVGHLHHHLSIIQERYL